VPGSSASGIKHAASTSATYPMLDLYKAEQFINRFYIRSREGNRPIPFILNPSQKKVMQMCREHIEAGNRMYVIFDKSRRLGITSLIRSLTQCHLLEKPFAEALIMAQLKPVASSIYEDSVTLAKQLNLPASSMKYTQQEMNFWKVPSKLKWNTANSVKGARGLAYTNLHATEAAFYEDDEVFTAVLNTLSGDPENMAFIETTANGTEGPGQAYFELWEASVAGETEFLPIFLPWWEDPDYIRNPKEAADAPSNDYEKYLMHDLKLGKERVAYYRFTLANKCSGKLDKWRREYPGTAKESFEVTGEPVFDFEDMTTANKAVKPPVERAEIRVTKDRNGNKATPYKNKEGRFYVYEKPRQQTHYFVGVTIGRGDGPDDQDTIGMVCWNGETGKLAARFVDQLNPANAAELVCGFGLLYNKAMVAVNDGNGGFGSQIIQELRDRWRYPNPYRWKGRNDRLQSEATAKTIGFSVSEVTRKMLLNGFIASLKRGEVTPVDELFVEQMPSAQWEEYYPYDPVAGDDEVLWAGLIGWIARSQHHPRQCTDSVPWQDEGLYDEQSSFIPHKKSNFSTSMIRDGILTDEYTGGMNLQSHLDARDRKEREYGQPA